MGYVGGGSFTVKMATTNIADLQEYHSSITVTNSQKWTKREMSRDINSLLNCLTVLWYKI